MSAFQCCQHCFFELVYYRGGGGGGSWIGGRGGGESNRTKGALSQSECQLFSVLLSALLLRIGILRGGGVTWKRGGGGGEGVTWKRGGGGRKRGKRIQMAESSQKQCGRHERPTVDKSSTPRSTSGPIPTAVSQSSVFTAPSRPLIPTSLTPPLPPPSPSTPHPLPHPSPPYPPIPQSCTMPACFSTTSPVIHWA